MIVFAPYLLARRSLFPSLTLPPSLRHRHPTTTITTTTITTTTITTTNTTYIIIIIINNNNNNNRPQNVMVDTKTGRAYLVDFGIAEKYVMYKGTHKEAGGGAVVGTPAFASLNMHEGEQASRRDDMEALAYVLARVALGGEGLALPWEFCPGAKGKGKRKRGSGSGSGSGSIGSGSAVDDRGGGLAVPATCFEDLVGPKQEFCDAAVAVAVAASSSGKGKKTKKKMKAGKESNGGDFPLAEAGDGAGAAVCELLAAARELDFEEG